MKSDMSVDSQTLQKRNENSRSQLRQLADASLLSLSFSRFSLTHRYKHQVLRNPFPFTSNETSSPIVAIATYVDLETSSEEFPRESMNG